MCIFVYVFVCVTAAGRTRVGCTLCSRVGVSVGLKLGAFAIAPAKVPADVLHNAVCWCAGVRAIVVVWRTDGP